MIVEYGVHGHCLGREWESAIAVVDTDAPVVSGDVVRVVFRHPAFDTNVTIFKQLETTRDGKWYLQCLEATIQIGRFVPSIIEKVIERRTVVRNSIGTAWHPELGAGRDDTALWDSLSLDARVEWTRDGKARGVPFPGIFVAARAAL